MSVSLHEHRLGRLRWIVVHGPDREAFRALGEHARGELTALTEAWPVLPRLRRHVSGPPGSQCRRRRGRGHREGSAAPGRQTLVADLTAGEAVIAMRDDDPVAIPLRDLAEGNPRAQRPLAGG